MECGKHCSLPREQIIVGKLLWDDFFDFLKIFYRSLVGKLLVML
jgi:hypothetical protein